MTKICKKWTNNIEERGLIQVKIFDTCKEEKKIRVEWFELKKKNLQLHWLWTILSHK